MLLRGPIFQEDSYWRETGYRSALEANGIPFDERLMLNGDFERNTAYKVMNEFIATENEARAEVAEHLAAMLSTRVGSSLTCPDYGMASVSDVVLSCPGPSVSS